MEIKRKTYRVAVSLILAGIMGAKIVQAEEIGFQPKIFDLPRLEKIKNESFDNFWQDINERDIFSSPKLDKVSQEVVAPPQEKVKIPETNLIYRGSLVVGEEQLAMIEVVKDGMNKSYFLRKGEYIEGFRIVDINREFVLIYSQKKGEQKLFLLEDN